MDRQFDFAQKILLAVEFADAAGWHAYGYAVFRSKFQ
jgi:hypothetical protein